MAGRSGSGTTPTCTPCLIETRSVSEPSGRSVRVVSVWHRTTTTGQRVSSRRDTSVCRDTRVRTGTRGSRNAWVYRLLSSVAVAGKFKRREQPERVAETRVGQVVSHVAALRCGDDETALA